METIIIIALVGALNVVCFFVGSKLGHHVVKSGNKQMPSVNPIKAIKEHNIRKEAEKEAQKKQNRYDTIMSNIDNYDGTEQGQKDVPN